MTKDFTIEKIKWNWAEAVQSKNVYRDDEFIRTKTKEEALLAAQFLLNKPQGLTYIITVRRDNEYFTYYRHSMPCLGGLVKYKDANGPAYYMNPYFPRDIRVAFPEGDIIYIGVNNQNIKEKIKSPYFEFVFSKESPWKAAFNSRESIIFNDNNLILTDMNTDPTVFYSLMRLGGVVYGNGKPDWNPKADILFNKCSNAQADPRRLAGQKPIKTSGGMWSQGYGYSRPFNESIFKTTLPCKLKNFGTLAGYPKAPQDSKYFIDTMKKEFKVDITNTSTPDKKTQDALIEAWDYFKIQSKELSDD